MKNYLLGVLTVLVIGLMSFKSIEDILTVKPALPSKVFVVHTYISEVKTYIYKYSKMGYVVHTATAPNSSGNMVLVMYKY